MKRIFAFFLSVVFVLGCIPQTILSVGVSALDYTPGDLKIDGVINSTDVVYLRRYIAGGYGITLDERAADVNADGILNTTDVVCLRRYIAGGYGIELKPAPEVECQHIVVIDPAKAPTCDTTGLTEGKHCSVCGEVLVKQEIVPVTGHTVVIDPAKAPTCDTTGLTEGKHCSVCGEVLVKQEIVPVTGHTVVVDPAQAPTCDTTGLTEGKHCSVCGEVLVKQEIVPVMGHTVVIDPAKAPTCDTTGLTEGKHCSVCGEVLIKQEIVPVMGHTVVIDPAQAPTCDTTGLTEGKHCSVCGEVLVKQEIVPVTGHTVVVDPAKAPTCDTTGLTEGKHCSVCGEVLVKQTTIEKTAHDYQGVACRLCGVVHPNKENYQGKVISILGDSISTFAGYIPIADGFNLEHIARYPQDNLLTDVNETWWMQLISQLDAKLGINDSWRSTEVFNYITEEVNSSYDGTKACMASLTRIQNLGSNGTPDVILFYGGTNDITGRRPLVTFDPQTAPAEVDLTSVTWDTVTDAYVAAIMRLQYYYPNTQIVAMLPTFTSTNTDSIIEEYNSVFAAICEHYGVSYIDLRYCGISTADLPDGTHPNAKGMDDITEMVLEELLSNCDTQKGENIVCSVTHHLNYAQSSLSYYRGVSYGESFFTAISGEKVSVTITMNGIDITSSCYVNGEVYIESVTGDIIITAVGEKKTVYEDYLQQLPQSLCAGVNLWEVLQPINLYYTSSGWGTNSTGLVYSVTIPISSGDRLWATSFQEAGLNLGTGNGIRVTWFDADGVLLSMGPNATYAEFSEKGYLEAPEGAVAVNIPMWQNSDSNELYILNRLHCNIDVITPPTCTAQGFTTHTCTLCGYEYADQYVSAKGHTYSSVITPPTHTAQGYTTHTCSVCGSSYRDAYTPATGLTDRAQAVSALRQQMVERKANVEIWLLGSALTSSDASAILLDAMSHTGVPDEGDYLKVNLGSYSYSVTTGSEGNVTYSKLLYSFTWYTTRAMEDEVDAAVKAVLAGLNIGKGTEYERIKAAYDWVTEYVQYDFDNLDEEGYKIKYTPYAALINRIAVCQGFAGLYYRLTLELGIDCRYITGDADGERHGWNIVRLDGKYYNMDPTWDRDLMGHYRQFLCTEANFKEHVRDTQYNTAAFHAQYPMAVTPYVFNVAASGTVNANISWVLDGDTGTLTVAGKGSIPSYRYSHAPWYDYRESVKSIVVGEGITEVGERAFYWCTNCTSVTLPSTLTAIREYGFNNLRSLEQITLPNNLRILEFCAFSECVALKSIVLPDSVTTVETNVFSNCYALTSAVLSNGMKTVPSSMFGGDYNLTSVVLPKGVTYIDDTAFINAGLRTITIPSTVTGLGTAVFSGCKSLTAIYVEAGNTAFQDIDGVLFSADGKTLVCYPSGKYGSYNIPSGTVKIAYGAFRSAKVTGLAIPGTLTTIEGYAFSYCTNLTGIAFPANVTRIGDSAFRGCSRLSSVTFYNDSVVLESAVFADCDALAGITLPAKLKEIPSSLFYDCGNLRSITIPSTVTKIGSSAFIDCDNLTTVTVPSNVKSIGQQAFDFCNRLQTIILEEGVTSLGWIAIRNAPALTKVVLPSSLTSIDRENFTGCPKVELYVNCGTAGYRYAINNGYNYCASHPYTKSTVIAPTCTAEGYTRKSCACGLSSYTTNYVPAKGHSYAGANCTACGVANPDYAENVSLCYDDHYDVTGKAVEIIDAGQPTSYQVGYGVGENTILDTAVVTLDGGFLIATGIGTAKVKIDGVPYHITVEAAPISLLLLIGQSNMQGSEGDENQSIICPDGMVYATYGDRYTMTVSNATDFAPSALTGAGSALNVNGTTDSLADWPVYLLNEQGVGKKGPDSGFAYEWVKQTGEKVWVVNAAHGGSSITTWQKTGENYKEALSLFTACQETLRKEIAAGHYTLSHMGYFWCQGCTDYGQTAEWYIDKYLTMHENLKTQMVFDHDSNSDTSAYGFEFGGIIPVRAGHDYYISYRQGIYADTTSKAYHESFKDLRFTGPRVAQYWMINNPELTDIWGVCNIGEDWVWMPDGTNGVTEYFRSHYPNGTVDYTPQVAQVSSWYTPTTPADIHDSIHYNQIGYNEVGRESARNALILLGEIKAPDVEIEVDLLSWDGYTPIAEIPASTAGNSDTLIVPMVYPIWKSKEATYELTEGLRWNYYDLLSDSYMRDGTLSVYAGESQETIAVTSRTLNSYRWDLEGGLLVSTGETENAATRLGGSVADGLFMDTRYQLADPIILLHDQNWVLEWKMTGPWYQEGATGSQKLFCEDSASATSGAMCLLIKGNENRISIGYYGSTTHISYGVNLNEYGISMADTHVYRLVNHVNADGSNMIYLYIDGKQIAPMTRYFTGTGGDQGTESDALSGMDISFNYLGSPKYTLNAGVIEYISVVESGGSADIHFHDWGDWAMMREPSAESVGMEERACVTCFEAETREVEGVWQKYDFANHYSALPDQICRRVNLWEILEHDKYYFAYGIEWDIYSTGQLYSVTIPAKPGDLIYATSFKKAGENGHSSTNGIRTTFFNAYGVAKTLTATEAYEEYVANGGYLIAPEGTVAVNIAMWSNSNDNELFILNREHDTSSEICSACGGLSHEHIWSEWETLKEVSREQAGERMRACSGCGLVERETVNSIWQTTAIAEHWNELPEQLCSDLNLWAVLEHSPMYYVNSKGDWDYHYSKNVPSVTFAVEPGDMIYATSFGKAVENGHASSNGIRVTFLGMDGVVKTLDPAGTYREFAANGGYLIVPQGAIAINLPMWNNSDENEIYILNREHHYAYGKCLACGASNPDYAEQLSLRYDDHYSVTGKTVEIIDAGQPTSYQVGYGVGENTVLDTAVVTLREDTLIATGIGTAKVKMDGVPYHITVEAAPISLLLLIGQSNMRGSEGNADQSIVCPDGMVYATFGDDRGDAEGIMNVNNATNFAASALTGEYSTINVNGTSDNLSYYPIYSLTESGKGTFGPDSGFAYEWVKQTGEKVWIVNAAHGGSSITSWQPNATNFKEAVLLFSACQETLRKEIAAGHFTLSHMGYFWCQGCSDYNWTAEKYVTNYLAMHDGLKSSLAFDHDGDAATDSRIFEFAGIIPVRAGHDYNDGYREGVYADTTSYKFYESFMDLQMTGPRVAQYWLGNNPDYEDIWLVCNIGEDWVWMPDGTNGVSAYFESQYPNGTVNYTTQVAQKASWYTPTTPAAVHDSIHYNQIGYNEVGRESARNALIMLGVIKAPEVEITVELLSWDGYTSVDTINASLTGNSSTLVVPKVYPVWRSKDVSYTLTEGFTWSYYDVLANDESYNGSLSVAGQNVTIEGHTWDAWETISEPSEQGSGQQRRYCSHCDTWQTRSVDGSWQLYSLADHMTELPEDMCGGVNLWDVRTPDNRYFTGTGWSGSYKSITIPVNGGDKIYATSLGKAGTNGHASISGHRITYFDNYGVLLSQGYGVTAPEFDANGGYLIVPEGAVAINISIWDENYENEVYILNREHRYENNICSICHGEDPSVVHNWSEWEIVVEPSAEGVGLQQRICADCQKVEEKVIKGVWQIYSLNDHLLELPENICCTTNLWAILPHEDVHFTSGKTWGRVSTPAPSVTIPVNAGDRVYATSFIAKGDNGGPHNGIRLTFFNASGVAWSVDPTVAYKEWSSKGYIEAPEGTIAANIPMWYDSEDYELYILNREHCYDNGICLACGSVDTDHAEQLSLRYDDHYSVSGKMVEIIDAGQPTSYQVGYGVGENTVLDTAVVTLRGDTLIATGIGTAKVKIDGVLYEITVEAAPISLLLLIGQSNMQGIDGNAAESIVCPTGMVYATYADRYQKTVEDVTKFAPAALTGAGSLQNVTGDAECLSQFPVHMLTEDGDGREGMDSGIAYEWVKNTGEKVWVINVAYGGSSITEWQKGGIHYEDCYALFDACRDTLEREIAAGHFTLSHMGYFWCQGCADETKTAEWYVEQYLRMHNTLKENFALSDGHTFEFSGIIPIRAGHSWMDSYRAGSYEYETTVPYYQSFKDLRFNGPRVAQYWMGNNPALTDIWNVCTIQESWATLPDGTDGVAATFMSRYENGKVDYVTQVPQKESWYTPTTPVAVHDNIHYNQIGYNEIGREAARNALILLEKLARPQVEATVKFVSWDGFSTVDAITSSTTGNSATLVVPMVSPVWMSKEVTYAFSDGLFYDFYDLTVENLNAEGTLCAVGAQGEVAVRARELSSFRWYYDGNGLVCDHLDGYSDNPLQRLAGSVTEGIFSGARYSLSQGILLAHDHSWVMEIELGNWTATSGSMLLGSSSVSTDGQPYVYFRPTDFFVGIGYYDGTKYHNYGLSLKQYGIACASGTHCYRFENRICEDGSNMIYLWVDGVEIGALNHHYINSTLSDANNDWMCGKDFSMNFIGTSNAPLNGLSLISLLVLEDIATQMESAQIPCE